MKFKDINLLSLAIAISIWDEDVETIVSNSTKLTRIARALRGIKIK